MWHIKPDYVVKLAGCIFERPGILLEAVDREGRKEPVLEFGRSEVGILEVTLHVYSRNGSLAGTVVMGEENVKRGFGRNSSGSAGVLISTAATHWKVLRKDTCGTVCEIRKVWVLQKDTLEVTLNMWLAGRPVKITPAECNLPELKPAGHVEEPLKEGSILLKWGVYLEHAPYEVPPHRKRALGIKD